MNSDELKRKFSKLTRTQKKKAYERWRDYFPSPCLEHAKYFLELLELKPWKNAYIWRPRSKYRMKIVNGYDSENGPYPLKEESNEKSKKRKSSETRS